MRRSIIFIAITIVLVGANVLFADEELPFVLGAGAGAVADPVNDFGWMFRLDGSGHPGGLPWLQLGLEVVYFGRPERKAADEEEEIPGGLRRTVRYQADGGILTGAVLHFPFGFGGLERAPEKMAPGLENRRRVFDAAPMLSGGLYIDGRTVRETVTTDKGGESEVHMSDNSGDANIRGGYVQIGGRFRWTVLEMGIGVQGITDRPVQGIAWLGADIFW